MAMELLAQMMGSGQRLEQVVGKTRQVYDADPDDVQALQAYAEALMALGEVFEGAALFRQAIERQPDRPELNYGLLWNLHYLPGYDRGFFRDQYVQWAERVFNVTPFQQHRNDATVERPLRVGILSGNLVNNSVMTPYELIFERIDPEEFELIAYSDVAVPDEATRRWQALCSEYRCVYDVPDEQVAQWIRDDQVDILFEVGGYCRGSRLGVMAFKPAPVQVDLGALSTLGMSQIDYRLSDPLMDPPESQCHYVEQLMPISPLWPFIPPDCCPEVTPLPALTRPFTFGCFNNNRKITRPILELWAAILKKVPCSRLMIKCPQGDDPAVQKFYRDQMVDHGIAADRLVIYGHCPFVEHLTRLSQCDLLLDTFPFNAARGTLEALWMGVPTLTYCGDVPVSRAGMMFLKPLGLDAFIAYRDREYVDKAVSFARQPQELQVIRQSLRQLMRASCLCDVPDWTRQFERALRQMWQRWCEKQRSISVDPSEAVERRERDGVLDIIFGPNSPIRYRIVKQGLPRDLLRTMKATEQGDRESAGEMLTDDLVAEVESLLQQQPDRADAAFLLALTLRRVDRHEQARFWCQRANALSPHPFISFELAAIDRDRGELTKAIETLKDALQQTPDCPELKSTLAEYLMKAGRPGEGLSLMQEVVQESPDPVNESKYLWHQHQWGDLDEASLFRQHCHWAQCYAPKSWADTTHQRDCDPQRRLKVGYISGDFCSHSVAYFLEPLLDAHHGEQVETWGYGNVPHQDLVTQRLQGKFNHYRNICGVSDKQVLAWMQDDALDILVDLSGHTGENRLSVLAHKPAPIQVSYLGYPDTTGMEQIDYRFTDQWADRPEAQAYYTETLVNLDSGFICYGPPGFAPEVKPLPARKNGFVTFGSFNNSYKINDKVIALWSRLLQALPESRLLLKFGGGDDDGVRRNFQKRFAGHGIDPERLRIVGRMPVVEHLDLYNQVDLALDTFPYHGTTTTCEALWMGVPVVSLVGQHHVSRVGLSLLSRVGLEIFASASEVEWGDKAVAFSRQIDHLAQIRQGLRGCMWNSPLCDKQSYASSVERAYRKMWTQWLDKSNG